ncbi:MAG: DUF1080 domain-containing protein [Verrucomicrobia bacterium]|nr:DUF1080 domain-containing protein [Verrucomicrobiota bacterium]
MEHKTRMKSIVLAITLVVSISSAVAAEAKLNPLSPEELAQGWILLFDGQTTFGWKPRGEAKWNIADGVISAVRDSGIGFLGTTTEFPNYQLKAEFWIDDIANSGIFLRCPTSGAITATNAYEVNIYDKHATWPTGSINEVARTTINSKTAGRWNSYDVTADGDRLVLRLNDKVVLDTRDKKHARGTIALQYNGQGEVKFRNVKLKPLGLQSIFNGKDLSGWKEIPDRKSVYSVTPEGWLNVKNGNGDLQSVGAYGDFVFQLDILSNGKHLNSGVFFRSEPGQFWSGYESQIRNQWEGGDRSKPVDFGTGGVYGHQKTRRVIPSDGEWFTKTIAAHGPHIAVWVNGIQVSDFTDTRTPDESARRGYRAKPGVLSLQGHDPTTDLSFRNIRIAEMPAGAR